MTSLAPLAVQKTRIYKRFSEAAQDVVDARVYLGIHFRFADTAARKQGEQVAEIGRSTTSCCRATRVTRTRATSKMIEE